MLPEIRDPVRIMNGAVLFHLIKGAKTVLHDHERHFGVSVMQKVQCVPKAVRIDLPAPIRGLQIGVLRVFDHVACRHLRIRILRHAAGLVIREGVQVDRSLLENLEVALLDEGGVNPVVLKELKGKLRILSADLHVAAQIVLEIVLSLESKHIGRIGRQRIYRDMADHIADDIIGVDLMAQLDCKRRREEFMVKRRVRFLQIALQLCQRDRVIRADIVLIHKPKAIQVADPALAHAGDVDLIESQPVPDLSFITPKYSLRIAQEEVDGLPGIESVVLGHDIPRNLVVAQRHQRLNAVFAALVKHLVIEGQTRLIGLFVVSIGENPAPVDGKPETGKSHLCKQRDVLFVMMIEVDCLMAGIKRRLVRSGEEGSGRIHIAAQQHIRHTQSFAILQIRAFALICGHSAAPQKVLGKSHFIYLLVVLLLKPFAHCSADVVQIAVRRIILRFHFLAGHLIRFRNSR